MSCLTQCAKTSKAECLNNCIKLLELPIPFINSPGQSMVLIGHDRPCPSKENVEANVASTLSNKYIIQIRYHFANPCINYKQKYSGIVCLTPDPVIKRNLALSSLYSATSSSASTLLHLQHSVEHHL